MKNESITTIIFSIVTVVVGLILNFQEFLMGSPATEKNLIVTFTYIGIWIYVLITSIKSNNHEIMKYSAFFWIITLFLAILTAYINATGSSADWAIPLVILFLGQWYGINFFIGSFLTASIVIAFISLVMVTTTVVALKHIK